MSDSFAGIGCICTPEMLRASADETNVLHGALAAVEMIQAAEGDANKRPTFKIKAYTGGPMQASFYLPVILDMAGGKSAGTTIPILMAHDETRPLGMADDIQITPEGVTLTGSFTGDDEDSMRVIAHAKNGFKWQASVGATVERREYLEAGKSTKVNGKTVSGPLIIARAWTLRETSIVTIGADGKTSAKIAAKQGNTKMDPFNQWLQAQGITVETFEALNETVQASLRASFDATNKVEAAAPAVSADEIRKITAAAIKEAATDAARQAVDEVRNAAAIERLTANHPDIRTKALAEKWTPETTELHVLRASRPQGPNAIIRGNGGEVSSDVLTAALCQAGGLKDVEKQYDDKTLQAAHTAYRGRISLQQILLQAAWDNGYTGRHFQSGAADMTAILKAAFSTLSLPGILSNTANKFLLQGFMGVETSWRAIAATRNVKDFKTITSYRMTGAFTFAEVAPTGELEHGTFDEESFTNQAKTYGRMAAITRTDLINDDLGALTTTPQRVGRGGALKLNDVFWTEFKADHSTFFPTDGSKLNYISGASSALGSAGMALALAKFMRKTDTDGKPLALTPAWLLVPPELEVAARELFQSTTVNTGGSATTAKVPNANIFSGRYPPIVSQYLTDTGVWYLGASPADMPLIEVAFLNGVEQPTVETAEADFNTLGIQMRGYFDFGVNKQDQRAAVKSAGQ